ncbi:MAG: ATP-binding cassette domain-containing protein [Acholeplasmatales bacterium]|nr:ATP-binding cassette domain-containing protein [Acholeplasmatales bacterium]
MFVLETKGLTKKYGEHLAVDHVNMHIEKGDIYGFVGENGAGKTTIIRLITGLASATEGNFELFGVDNNSKEISLAKKKLGGIVESVSINMSMNAMDNLSLQAILAGVKLTLSDKENLLKKVGLNPEEIAKKKVNSFSLGMRQRLGIAMTLVSNPEFIILDEPMNGLDPKGFIEIRDVILELNKEGITFLISSHILSELEKICTKIGFISHGKLIKELTIEDIHNQSKKRIVIEALDLEALNQLLKDKMNLVDTKIVGKELYIYDSIDINEILRFLVKSKIEIININKSEDTIETYYMKLIGGSFND